MREPDMTQRARELRSAMTKSEGLLWSVLRARQLCDLKFRRQHPWGNYILDFACIAHQLAVEIDGGYHDQTADNDLQRQRVLEKAGWKVLRFTADEVEQDCEAVARAIAATCQLPYAFQRRKNPVHQLILRFRPKPP